MTDQSPIMVNGDPRQALLETMFRQAITVAGVIAGALGYTKFAGSASALLLVAGPVASAVAIVWGQLEAYRKGKEAAIMAAAAPNSVAQVKS